MDHVLSTTLSKSISGAPGGVAFLFAEFFSIVMLPAMQKFGILSVNQWSLNQVSKKVQQASDSKSSEVSNRANDLVGSSSIDLCTQHFLTLDKLIHLTGMVFLCIRVLRTIGSEELYTASGFRTQATWQES